MSLLRNSNHSCRIEHWRPLRLAALFAFISSSFSFAYQQPPLSRRGWIQNTLLVVPPILFPLSSQAEEEPNTIDTIQQGRDTLSTLLANWERATVDCTYADVPRELLDTKNKEELLEKASTFALFDKSTSVETCKTSNRIVRDYLGVTGKGPLVGMDKRLRKSLDLVDPDRLDDYVNEVETFSQSMSRASALSFMAGTADFDSVNNFEKDKQIINENSNLEQSRRAIAEAKISMDRILELLKPV